MAKLKVEHLFLMPYVIAGDVGGGLGLFIGASVIFVFELFDLFLGYVLSSVA